MVDFVYSQMHVHSGLSAPTSLPGGHYPGLHYQKARLLYADHQLTTVSKLEDSQLANVG